MTEMMFDYPDEVALERAGHIPQTPFYLGLLSHLRDTVRKQLAVHEDDGQTTQCSTVPRLEVKEPPIPLPPGHARLMANASANPVLVKPPPAKCRGRASSAPAAPKVSAEEESATSPDRAPPQDGPGSHEKAGDKREREPSADDQSTAASHQRQAKRSARPGNNRGRDGDRGQDDDDRGEENRVVRGPGGKITIMNMIDLNWLGIRCVHC